MPIKDYSTTINVEKTSGEIHGILARRGVQRISTIYDDDGRAAGLAFTMKTDYGLRDFELPVKAAGVLAAFERDPKVPRASRNPEQAARTAWRIAKDWLEAQAALIDASLATLDEVMLPYMVGDRGQTFYALYRANQKALES